VTGIVEFQPAPGADGGEATRMTCEVEHAIGLGPLGLALDRIRQSGMRANMRTLMVNPNPLMCSEAPNTRDQCGDRRRSRLKFVDSPRHTGYVDSGALVKYLGKVARDMGWRTEGQPPPTRSLRAVKEGSAA
jgi:hypothetical protein